MDDIFAGAKDLIDSATTHFEEFVGIIEGVLDDDVTLFHEIDAETGNLHCKVRFASEIPLRAATRAFNIATELRAALDHSVYAATAAITGRIDPGKAKFPFGDTPAQFEQEFLTKADHVPTQIRTVISALKPYEAGNTPLWMLNKLRNIKDHRKLLVPSPTVDLVNFKANGNVRRIQPVRGTPDNDYLVAIITIRESAQLDISIFSHVVFGEAGPLSGIEPMGLFNAAIPSVVRAVTNIEAATIGVMETRS